MSSGKMLAGVLVGLAAGTVLGILFAPDSGTETRKKLKKKSGDYVDALKDKFGDYVDTIADKYEDLKGEAKDMAAKGKKEYNEARQ